MKLSNALDHAREPTWRRMVWSRNGITFDVKYWENRRASAFRQLTGVTPDQMQPEAMRPNRRRMGPVKRVGNFLSCAEAARLLDWPMTSQLILVWASSAELGIED